MTCNRQLQNNDVDPQRPYTNREFEAVFPGLVPFDIEDNCCAVVNTPKTIRKMVNSYCSKVLRERSRSGGDRLIFHPLYNIKYNERGAAGMYTYGGIILNEDFDDGRIRFKFNGVPSPEVREVLKSRGFKWSPSNKAWQRQNTPNGVWSAKKVMEELKQYE